MPSNLYSIPHSLRFTCVFCYKRTKKIRFRVYSNFQYLHVGNIEYDVIIKKGNKETPKGNHGFAQDTTETRQSRRRDFVKCLRVYIPNF